MLAWLDSKSLSNIVVVLGLCITAAVIGLLKGVGGLLSVSRVPSSWVG